MTTVAFMGLGALSTQGLNVYGVVVIGAGGAVRLRFTPPERGCPPCCWRRTRSWDARSLR